MVDLKSAPKGTSTVVDGVTLVSGGDGKTYSPSAFERTFGYAPPVPASPSGISQSGQGPIVSPAGQVLYAGDPYPGTSSSLYQTVYVPGYGNITPAEAARIVPPPSSPAPPPPSPVQSSTSTNTLSSVRSQPRGTSATQDGVTAISGGDGRTYSPRAYERTFGSPPPQPTYVSAPQGAGAAAPAAQRYSATRITPPNVGVAGLASNVGPAGRTFDEITGKPYLSQDERLWYLAQLGLTVDPVGNVVPLQQGGQQQQQRQQQPQQQGGEVGPAGRTFDQITGQPYLSPEEREWYLAQLGQSVPQAPAPSTPGATGMQPSNANWSHWGEAPDGSSLGFGALGRVPYQGQTIFSPQVEQWRGLVQQYFRPEDVNKVLYIIENESGGQNILQYNAAGEQVGPAAGLLQIEGGERWPGRPSMQQLLDPATNLQVGAQLLYGG